jgi:hypothetical protein
VSLAEVISLNGFRPSHELTQLRTDGTPRGDSGLLRLFAGNETKFAEHVEESLGHLIGNAVERACRRQAALEKRRVITEAWSAFFG